MVHFLTKKTLGSKVTSLKRSSCRGRVRDSDLHADFWYSIILKIGKRSINIEVKL